MEPDPGPTPAPGEVDVTLIRWMLGLSPAERLQVLQDFVDDVEEARAASARKQISPDPEDPGPLRS